MPDSTVRQIKILVSSTRADLAQYREEASRVIKDLAAENEKRLQLVDLSMEKQLQNGEREFAVAVSKRWVEESDWIVVILGWNYGTISDEPGANGLSVTEWEYRHASALGKKRFVFIAGDPGTADRYRVSEEEREDLKDWIPKQTVDQTAKLEKFKCELSKPFTAMFANLQTFKERLAMTLKAAIENLPPDIHPGTPLAELIVAMQPKIRDCIRKVTLIANCKAVHDYLHELYHHVIRPLRDEVLEMWKQEGTLSVSRERIIWRCMTKNSEAVGGIRAVITSIGPDHQGLRDSVEAVLQRSALWDIDSDSADLRPSREEFTEVVDEFAVDVQEAFSEADRSMWREESNLRERYVELLEDLKRARKQRKLSPSDHRRLDEELKKINVNRLRVKSSLISHNSWQVAHDKLEELDSFREMGCFDRKLNHYCGSPLSKLLNLVIKELEQVAAPKKDKPVGKQPEVAAVADQAPSQAPILRPAFDAFVNDLNQLKESLEALRQGAGVVAFDKMRKPFNNAFYYIDKRTLNEVDQAQERAVNLEDWLNGLAAAQTSTG